MADSNETRQLRGVLTPGVPTVWLLPGGCWIFGIHLTGLPPCYFVGGPFRPPITGAFASFWAASAAAAKAMGQDWARHVQLPMVRDISLEYSTAKPPVPGWKTVDILFRGLVQGCIALSTNGPLPLLYDTFREASAAAVEAEQSRVGVKDW